MLIGNKRALAYTVKVSGITPIDGADNIELVKVNDWHCIAKKGEFAVGDMCVYFEIDSLLPSDKQWAAFLAPKKFKVKTMKLNKFNCISQGLALPISSFEEEGINIPGKEKVDVTDLLGVKYIDQQDNERKAPTVDKYKAMASRHSKLFKNKFIRKICKTKIGKKVLFLFFGKKKKTTSWPEWVTKTDEERIQNCGFMLKENCRWIATEKIDGTSTTVTVKRRKFFRNKFDVYVCSRNVVFKEENQKCFYDTNVYTEIAKKYKIPEALIDIANDLNIDWVTFQGEIYGTGIQKRNYSTTDHLVAGFNLVTPAGRMGSIEGKTLCSEYGIPWVPILNTDFKMPDTVDELLKMADGNSVIDGLLREGYVFRSEDGSKSFKAVSNEYLLGKHQ